MYLYYAFLFFSSELSFFINIALLGSLTISTINLIQGLNITSFHVEAHFNELVLRNIWFWFTFT